MATKAVTIIGNAGGPLDTLYELFLIKLSGIGTTTTILPDISGDGMKYTFKRKDGISLRNYVLQGFAAGQTIDGAASLSMSINTDAVRVISYNGVWETY